MATVASWRYLGAILVHATRSQYCSDMNVLGAENFPDFARTQSVAECRSVRTLRRSKGCLAAIRGKGSEIGQ